MTVEVNVNFVLLEDLKENPGSNVIETRIVIVCGSKDSSAALNEDGATNFDSLE
jgi:hypothetical protein